MKLRNGILIRYNEDSLFAKIQMRILKRKAKNIFIKTGRQQHIIPSGKGHVMIVDNRWRKAYNIKNKKNRLSFKRLMEISYFSTSTQLRLIE